MKRFATFFVLFILLMLPLCSALCDEDYDFPFTAVVVNPKPEERLNLRTEPDTSSATQGKFYTGVEVEVTDIEDDWAEVTIGDGVMEGYMLTDYLKLEARRKHVTPATPEITVTHPGGKNLYDKRISGAKLLGTLKAGSKVTVLAVTADDWLLIETADGGCSFMKNGGISPAVSFAVPGTAAADELAAGSQLQPQATAYDVWVGGVQVTSANKGNVLGDKRKSVTYNPKNNTLTLKNAKIKSSMHWQNPYAELVQNDGILVATGGTFKIKLVGTSTITVPRKDADLCNGIEVFGKSLSELGDLVVYGNGKLEVKANTARFFSNGISVAKLTVKDKAKLVFAGKKATDKSYARYGGFGVNAMEKILITDNAQVTASGSKAAYYGYEIRVTPTYRNYTPRVKAGSSAKAIKVNQKSPAANVYTKYKYVSITKAA